MESNSDTKFLYATQNPIRSSQSTVREQSKVKVVPIVINDGQSDDLDRISENAKDKTLQTEKSQDENIELAKSTKEEVKS